jgi:hypothetical protein
MKLVDEAMTTCRHDDEEERQIDNFTRALLCLNCGQQVTPLKHHDQIGLAENPIEYWPSYFQFLATSAKRSHGFGNDVFLLFNDVHTLLSATAFDNDQLVAFCLSRLLETHREKHTLADFALKQPPKEVMDKMNSLLKPLVQLSEKHFLGRYCQAMGLTPLDELRVRTIALDIPSLVCHETAQTRAATMLYMYLQQGRADATKPSLRLAKRLQQACRLPNADDFASVLLMARAMITRYPDLFSFSRYPERI